MIDLAEEPCCIGYVTSGGDDRCHEPDCSDRLPPAPPPRMVLAVGGPAHGTPLPVRDAETADWTVRTAVTVDGRETYETTRHRYVLADAAVFGREFQVWLSDDLLGQGPAMLAALWDVMLTNKAKACEVPT